MCVDEGRCIETVRKRHRKREQSTHNNELTVYSCRQIIFKKFCIKINFFLIGDFSLLNVPQLCNRRPSFMREQAMLFAVLSCSAYLRTNQKCPIKPSDQTANERQVHSLIRDRGASLYPPMFTHPVNGPFQLKAPSIFTDEDFRTKVHSLL